MLEEAGRGRVDLELEVAVEVALADPLREEIVELVGVSQAHDPLDLAARVEPERRGVDDAEEAVAATDEAEEVAVLVARAGADDAVGSDHDEALDVSDERAVREPAAVDVRRDGSADRKVVGAGLLLADGPRRDRERIDESRPLDARLDLDQAALLVERQDVRQRAGIEDDPARTELLPAHRVSAACDRDRPLRRAGEIECRADRLQRVDRHDCVHFGLVEPRVDVVTTLIAAA